MQKMHTAKTKDPYILCKFLYPHVDDKLAVVRTLMGDILDRRNVDIFARVKMDVYANQLQDLLVKWKGINGDESTIGGGRHRVTRHRRSKKLTATSLNDAHRRPSDDTKGPRMFSHNYICCLSYNHSTGDNVYRLWLSGER